MKHLKVVLLISLLFICWLPVCAANNNLEEILTEELSNADEVDENDNLEASYKEHKKKSKKKKKREIIVPPDEDFILELD